MDSNQSHHALTAASVLLVSANVNLRFQGCAGPVPLCVVPWSGNQPSLAREAPVSGLGTSLRSSPGISGWVRPVRQPLRLRSRQPLRFRILAISKSHSLPR